MADEPRTESRERFSRPGGREVEGGGKQGAKFVGSAPKKIVHRIKTGRRFVRFRRSYGRTGRLFEFNEVTVVPRR